MTETSTDSLPAGVVTFLWTDIQWWGRVKFEEESDPEVVLAVYVRLDHLFRAAIESHGGVVSRQVGDSVLGVFASPLLAVMGAVEAHVSTLREPWPQGAPVRGRYGLYTGEDHPSDPHHLYLGEPSKRAGRLVSAMDPGQIGMGAWTAREVQDRLPSGIALVDEGTPGFRGLPPDEHVYSVRLAGCLM